MQGIALFSRKNYTAGTNFTQLLVVTVATNLNSVIMIIITSDRCPRLSLLRPFTFREEYYQHIKVIDFLWVFVTTSHFYARKEIRRRVLIKSNIERRPTCENMWGDNFTYSSLLRCNHLPWPKIGKGYDKVSVSSGSSAHDVTKNLTGHRMHEES